MIKYHQSDNKLPDIYNDCKTRLPLVGQVLKMGAASSDVETIVSSAQAVSISPRQFNLRR